ncbi:hypothetical protein Glove_714g15 [Diversispora epigaea]|uniref:Uncharacterized protein n=1 Tax=Diversispora epigaea TaxID=1348612 RepID=A0A397G6Y4_9GLOM|nr:hypothetical protein Glove_714g15 [Diversispora epigaea]
MNTSHNLDIEESQKQSPQTWNIKDLNQNAELIDKSPFSSTSSLVMPTNASIKSIKSENDKETQYSENFNNKSSPIFSDSEASSPTFYNLSPQRRRTLSGTSRHQERFSLNDLDSLDSNRYLSPPSNNVNKGNNKNNNRLSRSSSYEERENDFDRVRIGNTGKGYGSLISDERSKEIKKLIADVKDEDAFKLAQITQRHANLQSRRNSNFEIKNNDDYHHGIRPNKITLSKDCKKFIEEKYYVIFKITNNNGIYNPLKCVRNRRINFTNPDDSNNDSSTSLISNRRGKQNNNITGRRKGINVWNISPQEILYEYEQTNNNFVNLKPHHLTIEKLEQISQVDYPLSRVESTPTSSKKNSHRPTQEKEKGKGKGKEKKKEKEKVENEENEEKDELSSSTDFKNSRSKIKKHSKALSLNNIGQKINNNEQNKSKRWSLHLFKRKDKNLKRKLSKKDKKSEKIEDVRLHLSNSQKNLIDSSASDHTSRSSAEYSRSLSDREQLNFEIINNDIDSRQNGTHEEKYKSARKFEKEEFTDDTNSRRDSLDTSAEFSDNQSSDSENFPGEPIGNPEIHITMSEDTDYSPQGEKGYSDVYRSSSAEYENDSDEDDYEPDFIGETALNLDDLPGDLVQLIESYQKNGLIPKNHDGSRYVELDVGKDLFKFNKPVKHGDDLLNIRVSLVTNSNRSIDFREVEELIARYDYCLKELNEVLEINKEIPPEFIDNDDYDINNILSGPLVQSPVCNKSFNFSSRIQFTETVHELKDRIDRGAEALNNSTDNMENIVKRLESQHNNITEEMKIMLDEIEKITNEVNKDYFNELQNLEDEIQFLIAETENSPWLDTFYLMMSYVIAGIMFMLWFIVAVFKLLKRILFLPKTIWKLTKYSK